MTDILYRKLTAWPQRDTAERKSRYVFSVGYANTLKQLEDELDKIDATDVVLEGFIPVNKIRRDGWPLSDTPSPHPGLRLSWQSRLVGTGELMTDEYNTWPANLRAIGLTLEALRAVGRYGAMTKKQQYKGLIEPPPKPAPSKPAPSKPDPPKTPAPLTQTLAKHIDPGPFKSVQRAAQWLSLWTDWAASDVLSNSVAARSAYNAAALDLHPDTGGTHELFLRLSEAKALLDSYHSEW